MAKCRNCKKDIDANATVCPYCNTLMPADATMAFIKTIIIVLFGAVLLAFLVYNLIVTIIEPTFLLALGMTMCAVSLIFFIGAKYFTDFSGNVNVRFNIKSGLICLGAGLAIGIPAAFFVF